MSAWCRSRSQTASPTRRRSQAILDAAGIHSVLETAVEHHPSATEDAPQKVLVAESALEAAQHAIEAMIDSEITAD